MEVPNRTILDLIRLAELTDYLRIYESGVEIGEDRVEDVQF